MHIHFLDPFHPGNSPLHQLDPRVKLLLTLLFILANALVPVGSWPVYILLFVLILSIEIISELGVSFVLARSVLALPFVLAALPLIITIPGPTWFAVPIGPWTISISYAGLERFVSITIKSWISVQAAIILASTTSFPDLLVAMRALHVPRLMVSIFSLMWRYLFILVDEATRLIRARLARSGHTDIPGTKIGGSISWRARVTGGMAGSLLLRAFDRSDRIYMAMVSRGYDGEARGLPLPEIKPSDRVILIIGIGVLGLLVGFAYIFWG